jgi:hypothetical protein
LGVVGALLLSSVAGAQTFTATMGAQSSVFTGPTRGYWFTAPMDFTITGVRVLVPTGSANTFQNFAVLRFTGATPPPPFSQTTNAFTQLALGLDLDQTVYQPVNVSILAGEVIGVYGNTTAATGTTTGSNSYAGTGQQTTTIGGTSVDLFRSGMQFHLGSFTSPQGMHDVWSEPSSFSISRVEFTYTLGSGPSVYCTSSTSTVGCSPAIGAAQQPSLVQSSPCSIAVSGVEGQRSTILFYGLDNSGFAPLSWAAGSSSLLCVKAPLQRTTVQSSGGTSGQCDGSVAFDWDAYQLGHPQALGHPWTAGASVFVQVWVYDPPAPRKSSLSDALELTYVP